MHKIDQIDTQYQKKILKEIVDEIEDCLLVYDQEGRLIYTNRQMEYLTGYRDEELKEKTPIANLATAYPKTIIEKMYQAIDQNTKFDTVLHLTKKGGTPFYLAISITGIKTTEDKIEQYICIGKDITSAKMLHEKMHRIKYKDELTGLPNQTAFTELIYNKINLTRKSAFNIVLVDVAKMNYINHSYGIHIGDCIVKEIGERLKKALIGKCVLNKLNTDVFAIIQEVEEDKMLTQQLVTQVFKVMKPPIYVNDEAVYMEVRCGIATYPQDSVQVGELINRAQLALEKAKKLHIKNAVMYYEKYIEDEVRERLKMENDMHKAYNNNEFIVYYQPFVDLNRKVIIGLEALLRRKKNNGQVVAPKDFIQLLEQMELIELVGLQVVEAVCRQLRSWIDEGYEVVPISINLSSAQFKNKNLAKDIINIVEKYGISSELIVLEITETLVMDDIKEAQLLIRELKEAGFMIAIDDFGTGYSSLGYLKNFLFDHLKIDISFIREIVENPEDRAIVAAIISIAKALKLKTVAEGIETIEQLHLMQEMGCEVGQGYFWDAPIAPDLIEKKYFVKMYR